MRIEWVRLRLENWALWKAREAGGGLGFASASSFLTEKVDQSRDGYRECVIPVDGIEAGVTDQAVTALRDSHPHLHATLVAMYIKGAGIKATARALGKAESTVHGHLEQADRALAAWFGQRAELKRAEARRNSFTA